MHGTRHTRLPFLWLFVNYERESGCDWANADCDKKYMVVPVVKRTVKHSVVLSTVINLRPSAVLRVTRFVQSGSLRAKDSDV